MKTALGFIAVVVTLISFVPYIRDVIASRTRPHVVSWFVWTALTLMAFIAQLIGGGGPGTWATGATASLMLVILMLAAFKGERSIGRLDLTCVAGMVGAAVMWSATSNPLTAVLMITCVDVLGSIPTFHKSYTKPYEETLSTYVLWSFKLIFSLFALERYSLITALYPSIMLLMDLLFITYLIQRRRIIARRRRMQHCHRMSRWAIIGSTTKWSAHAATVNSAFTRKVTCFRLEGD